LTYSSPCAGEAAAAGDGPGGEAAHGGERDAEGEGVAGAPKTGDRGDGAQVRSDHRGEEHPGRAPAGRDRALRRSRGGMECLVDNIERVSLFRIRWYLIHKFKILQ